ncbi:MAG: PAS domain S-box protein [Candidatus Brocadiia bacterium]
MLKRFAQSAGEFFLATGIDVRLVDSGGNTISPAGQASAAGESGPESGPVASALATIIEGASKAGTENEFALEDGRKITVIPLPIESDRNAVVVFGPYASSATEPAAAFLSFALSMVKLVSAVAVRNRALTLGTPDKILVVQRDGSIMDANITNGPDGQPVDQAYIGDWGLSASDETKMLSAISRALNTGKLQTLEYATGEGEIARDYEVRLIPTDGDEVIAVIRDITAMKQEERELKESRERLELVMRGADVGFWGWNIQTGEFFMNEKWADMLGYSMAEMEKYVKGWGDLIHPDDYISAMVEFESHLAGKTPLFEAEYRIRTKSGEWRWIQDRGRIVDYDSNARPLRASGIHLDITQRKQVEDGLRESRETYRNLVEAIRGTIVTLSPAGKITYINRFGCDFFGYPESELVGSEFLRKLVPAGAIPDQEYGPTMREIVRRAERHETFEMENIRRNGEKIWASWSNRALQDENGSVTELLCIGTDISERKRAEDALRRREPILRAVGQISEILLQSESLMDCLEDVLAMVAEASHSSRVQVFENFQGEGGEALFSLVSSWDELATDRYCASGEPLTFAYQRNGLGRWQLLLGRGDIVHGSVDSVPTQERPFLMDDGVVSFLAIPIRLGEEWWGFIEIDDTKAKREWSALELDACKTVATNLASAIQRDRITASLLEATRDAGTTDAAKEHGSKRRRAAPSPGWDSGQMTPVESPRDAANQTTADDAHRAMEDVWHAALDSLEDGVIATDNAGLITQVNAAATRMLGLPANEILGSAARSIVKLRKLNSSDPGSDFLENALKSDVGSQVNGPYRLASRRSGDRSVNISCAPLRGREGNRLGTLFSIKDVTEKLRLEHSMVRTQKLESLGRLAGGISNNFNNVLQGIAGLVEVLRDNTDPSQNIPLLERMVRAVHEGTEITRGLAAFTFQFDVARAKVDVNALLKQAMAVLKHSVDKRIVFASKLAGSALTIEGNPVMLENAFMNLSINACEAMANGGTLTVSTSVVHFDEPPYNLYGFSIAPGKFVEITISDSGTGMDQSQLNRLFEPFFTTKGPEQGRGLGLTSVYTCVRKHSGLVAVESAPGLGSTFKVYIPMVAAVGETPKEPQTEPVRGSGTILAVDDEDAVLFVLANSLRSFGYEVITANDGAEAVEIFKEYFRKIDMVLMDMVMPNMDGREALRLMKQIEPAVPVVMCSGLAFSIDESELKQEGIAELLPKPFTASQLSQIVARNARKPR